MHHRKWFILIALIVWLTILPASAQPDPLARAVAITAEGGTLQAGAVNLPGDTLDDGGWIPENIDGQPTIGPVEEPVG